MRKREYIQNAILKGLYRYEKFSVTWQLLFEALDDPREKRTSLGISMNEAVMLAGHCPVLSETEQFNKWCKENNIEWEDYNQQHVRIFHKIDEV